MRKIDPELVDVQHSWGTILYDQGFKMLNDEQLAKKQFRAMEDFIEFRKKAEDLVTRVFNDPKVKIVQKAFQ